MRSARAQRRRPMFAIARAVSFVLLAAATACSEKRAEAPLPTPRVKVFVVGKQATGQLRRISGRVDAADKSTLSFGVAGKVTEILGGTGREVVVGQVLAKLDSEPLQLALEKARADLGTARAKRDDAASSFQRTKRLLAQKGASQQDLDAATAALAAADGAVEIGKRVVRQAELDLQRTELTAPFSGRIVEIPIDPFQEVTANEPAFVIQADGALEIQVRVPETIIRLVDYGQVVEATFPSLDGAAVSGTVATIGAESESGNAFPVTIRLAETEADVRPGMTAGVTFRFDGHLEGRTAYLLPLSCVAIEAGLTAQPAGAARERSENVPVFVVDPTTSALRIQTIKVGDLRGNELEVFEGLAPGDQVVSAGVSFLREGMTVEVWQPDNGFSR